MLLLHGRGCRRTGAAWIMVDGGMEAWEERGQCCSAVGGGSVGSAAVLRQWQICEQWLAVEVLETSVTHEVRHDREFHSPESPASLKLARA